MTPLRHTTAQGLFHFFKETDGRLPQSAHSKLQNNSSGKPAFAPVGKAHIYWLTNRC
jgi:hypothetical protein